MYIYRTKTTVRADVQRRHRAVGQLVRSRTHTWAQHIARATRHTEAEAGAEVGVRAQEVVGGTAREARMGG